MGQFHFQFSTFDFQLSIVSFILRLFGRWLRRQAVDMVLRNRTELLIYLWFERIRPAPSHAHCQRFLRTKSSQRFISPYVSRARSSSIKPIKSSLISAGVTSIDFSVEPARLAISPPSICHHSCGLASPSL